MDAPGEQQTGDAPEFQAPSAPQRQADVLLASQAYLPTVFAVLTLLVWALPGPVRLGDWTWVAPTSAAAAIAGMMIPARQATSTARWLTRARNALGLVLLANVVLSAVVVTLAIRSLQLPLG